MHLVKQNKRFHRIRSSQWLLIAKKKSYHSYQKKGIYFGFVFLKQINKLGWRIKMDRISLVFNAEKKIYCTKRLKRFNYRNKIRISQIYWWLISARRIIVNHFYNYDIYTLIIKILSIIIIIIIMRLNDEEILFKQKKKKNSWKSYLKVF